MRFIKVMKSVPLEAMGIRNGRNRECNRNRRKVKEKGARLELKRMEERREKKAKLEGGSRPKGRKNNKTK